MIKEAKTKFRKGAASFYIVAFSTLILVVVAMSFAAIIISELTRTSNDDLSQSAYDSALAGVEDAKLAYYNYQSCLDSKKTFDSGYEVGFDGAVTCDDIVAWVEHPNDAEPSVGAVNNMRSCDMVGHILGRIPKGNSGEVVLQETSEGDNKMQQAYTCVSLDIATNDYRATLAGDNSTRVVPVKLKDKSAKDITSVRLSWYSKTDGSDYQFTNIDNSGVVFPQFSTKAATPPTISLGLIQTDATFDLDEFDLTGNNATNRGTIFLTPSDKAGQAQNESGDNHFAAYDGSKNYINSNAFVKSNDRTVKNLPYEVYCDVNDSNAYACSVVIELPNPIDHGDPGVTRNDETFMFAINIPYGQPSTDIQLEFCTSASCETTTLADGTTENGSADLKNVQVRIDSTGRANDLYRRVETRLDTSDIYFPYPLYALELLGDDGNDNLNKNMTVTCEYQDWGSMKKTCP